MPEKSPWGGVQGDPYQMSEPPQLSPLGEEEQLYSKSLSLTTELLTPRDSLNWIL